MFALSSLCILSAAVTALAGPHGNAARHNELAHRMEGTVSKRAAYNNVRMTWYPTDTGPDACTGRNHKDSDWYIALNTPQFGSGGYCGKKVNISFGGKKTTATIVDACATCDWGQIDFTRDLFTFFAGLDVGEIYGSWSFADDDNGGNDDNDDDEEEDKPKTTSKKHTTTKAPEPKPTPKATPKKEEKEEETTASTKKTSSKKLSSSSHSSSSKPSPSSSKAVVKSSSTLVVSASTTATPTLTPTSTVRSAVQNVGGATTSAPAIAGGIGTGSTDGAMTHGVSIVVVAISAVVFVASQAL